MNFDSFNFDSRLMEGLSSMGFKEATPIQEQVMPMIMEGSDVIACAQTGTGKTGAYLLPLIHNILAKASTGAPKVKALVIAPTRELALQIDQQVEGFAYFLPITSIPIYGGGDGSGFEVQKQALVQGADIIIATPGKLISHLNLKYADLESLEYLILDEADRMLDMGFNEDIMKIISYLPKKRQTLLFSATMPSRIRSLSKQILNNPREVSIALSKPAEGILQAVYMVYEPQKVKLVASLLKDKDLPSVVVFASTKLKVRDLEKALKKLNFPVRSISSDLDQSEREDVLNQFRSKKVRILVATDILARGIDIKGINLIINYDVPNDAEDYVHRIGRTARADATGVAITLVSEEDQRDFADIEKLIGYEVNKLPNPPDVGEGPKYDPKAAKSYKPGKSFKRPAKKGPRPRR